MNWNLPGITFCNKAFENPVAEEKFIWCHNCHEVHHVTAHDKAPLYQSNQDQDDGLAVDDGRAFMNRHAGHRLEALHSGDPVLWEGGGLDPVQEKYVEVTNGREWFVVRGFRRSIDESLRFELAPGRLRATMVAVEIQASEIRLEMKKHFFWGPTLPSDNKIDLFVLLFNERVSGLRPEEVRVSRYDCSDGAVGYAGLEDGFVETLLHACEPHFLPEEFLHLRRFVDGQRNSDGVMALRVKHRYGVDRPIGLASNSSSK